MPRYFKSQFKALPTSFLDAFRTNPLHDITDFLHLKILWNVYQRHGKPFQTESFFANRTGDMHMVLVVALIVAVAKTIFHGPASIVNLVYRLLLLEVHKRAENGGFTHSGQFLL